MTGCLVEVCPDPFDPWQRLALWSGDAAAAAIFIGRVRPTTMDDRSLVALELEHFPGLCERQITAMARRLQQEHQAGAILVLHRVGRLTPGEPIVLVAVQADRRGAAQSCLAALLEQIKHQAPFWKREWCKGQANWLAANTPL